MLRSSGSATEESARYEKASGGNEREFVHTNRNHPGRELIEAKAKREGESGGAAEEDAEKEKCLREFRGTHGLRLRRLYTLLR
jgi:hypothetical protein